MSKPLPIFCHLPLHIKESIVKATDLETKFSIRRCSKQLKKIVDKSPMHYDKINFDVFSDTQCISIHVHSDGKRLSEKFQNTEDGCFLESKGKTGGFMELAVEKLMTILTNHRVSVEHFSLDFHSIGPMNLPSRARYARQQFTILNLLEESLGKLNHKLMICEFLSRGIGREAHRILHFLKPRTLRSLSLKPALWDYPRDYFVSYGSTIDLSKFTELEQWKQAKELELDYVLDLTVEETTHFDTISYDSMGFSVRQTESIIENMTKNSRKVCVIHCNISTISKNFHPNFHAHFSRVGVFLVSDYDEEDLDWWGNCQRYRRYKVCRNECFIEVACRNWNGRTCIRFERQDPEQ